MGECSEQFRRVCCLFYNSEEINQVKRACYIFARAGQEGRYRGGGDGKALSSILGESVYVLLAPGECQVCTLLCLYGIVGQSRVTPMRGPACRLRVVV